jgi:hypothetical protein
MRAISAAAKKPPMRISTRTSKMFRAVPLTGGLPGLSSAGYRTRPCIALYPLLPSIDPLPTPPLARFQPLSARTDFVSGARVP